MQQRLPARSMIGLGLVASLTGCASVPPVEVSYYLPKATVTLTLNQSLQCSKGTPPALVAGYIVTPVSTFTRDPDRGVRRVALARLDGAMSDVDLAFGLSDDGRLLSVNTSQTGQGGAVVTSAMQLLSTVLAWGFQGKADTPPKVSPDVCKTLKDWTGKDDQAVTITYEAVVNFDKGRAPAVVPEFKPQASSDTLFKLLTLAGGVPVPRILVDVPLIAKPDGVDSTPGDGSCESQHALAKPGAPAAAAAHSRDAISVACTAPVPIRVVLSDDAPVWSGSVVVPIEGEYELPIGRSAAFGKQTFALALGPSGSPTSVHYTKDTGLASALGAANTALTTLQPRSAADQATELNAQADLIKAQQRLVKCKADPANCS